VQLITAVAVMPLLVFAAYTTAVTQNAFKWAGQTPKLTLPLVDLDLS